MDSDLSHEALNRFAEIRADLAKLFEHTGVTSTAEDNAKAAEEAAKVGQPPAPVDPRDAEIQELKKQLAAKDVSPHDDDPEVD